MGKHYVFPAKAIHSVTALYKAAVVRNVAGQRVGLDLPGKERKTGL